jgi:hypothetical protein
MVQALSFQLLLDHQTQPRQAQTESLGLLEHWEIHYRGQHYLLVVVNSLQPLTEVLLQIQAQTESLGQLPRYLHQIHGYQMLMEMERTWWWQMDQQLQRLQATR